TTPPAAKKRFEEIAEPGAAEFKRDAAAIAAKLIKSSARLTAPLRRRLESARLVPVGAQLIVFLAFVRIAQDFISFVDLLKFLLGGFFVLGDVGMVFARQFAKRAPDRVLRCLFGTAKSVVLLP